MIQSIQALRGIAALLVAGYHFRNDLNVGPIAHLGDMLFGNGPIGVDLFFVISGFIMVFITERHVDEGRPARDFILRRVARVVPAYWITSLIYGFLVGNPFDVPRFVKSALFLPLTSDGGPFFGFAFLFVGWTLNYEMYFYAVIAAGVLLPLAIRYYALAGWFALTLVAIPMLFGSATLSAFNSPVDGIYYLSLITNPLVLDFVAGMVIGVIYLRAPTIDHRATAAFVWFAIAYFCWSYFATYRATYGVTMWGIAASLLVLGLVLDERARPMRIPPFLLYLGDISYAIYLTHFVVKAIVDIYAHRVVDGQYLSGPPAFILKVLLTLGFAHLSTFFMEKPLLAKVERYIRGSDRSGRSPYDAVTVLK